MPDKNQPTPDQETAGRLLDRVAVRLLSLDADAKSAALEVDVDPWMRNAYGVLHGGMTGSIGERCITAFLRALGVPGAVRLETIQIDYYRPVLTEHICTLAVRCSLTAAEEGRYTVNTVAWLAGAPAEKPCFTVTGTMSDVSAALRDCAAFCPPSAGTTEADGEMQKHLQYYCMKGHTSLSPELGAAIPAEILRCDAERRAVLSRFETKAELCGEDGQLYTGFAACMLDTAMGQLGYFCNRTHKRTPTATLTVRCHTPAPVGPDLLVRTKVMSAGARLIFVTAEARSSAAQEQIAYSASGLFFCPDERV